MSRDDLDYLGELILTHGDDELKAHWRKLIAVKKAAGRLAWFRAQKLGPKAAKELLKLEAEIREERDKLLEEAPMMREKVFNNAAIAAAFEDN